MPEPYDAPAIVTFAKELTWRREKAELKKNELAKILGFGESYVGQVENCKNLPSEEFADALDTYFKTDGIFHRLWERIQETRHYSVVPPGFPEYCRYETQALYIKNMSPVLVTGLLQIEDYARTIIGAYQSMDMVDHLVRDRMQRRAVLDRTHANFMIDESVLHRVVGNAEIMGRQLDYLLEMSEHPNVSIEIIPSSVGFYPGVGGMLIVLGTEDGRTIVYTESSGMGLLIQDAVQVARHVIRYDSVRSHALPVEQSRALISQVRGQKYA
ncbi:helix-turn-helix domain-containing protein [Actinomadura atramentaria]|uniref:helix-turn-helix domain-containing protein n=1 Tax=Actinomadura atramentaria TaxID=1990 RepID=UPI00146B04F9|nr:helix-turn-helix transcriptional regulator [Actinomadura atramentaria]